MSVSLSRAFLFSFHIFSLVFIAVFSFIFSAHVIPFWLRAPSFYLSFSSLLPKSVSQFFGCFLLPFCALLLVLFLHIFHSCNSLFSSFGFLFFMFSPFARSLAEASLDEQTLIFPVYSKSLILSLTKPSVGGL